jgi:hypothetical protein
MLFHVNHNGRQRTYVRRYRYLGIDDWVQQVVDKIRNPTSTDLDLTLNLTCDPSIQPPDSLEVSTLLRKRLLWNTQIRADSEAMFRVRVQARLISLVTLEEDIFDIGPVIARVALVQISERNTDGRSDGVPLLGLCVGGVGSETGVDAFALCEVASDVLATKAVSDRSDFGGVVGCAEGVECGVDDRLDVCQWMTLLPFWQAVVQGRV